MNSILELQSVSKTIRGKQIVQDVSFTVNAGEVFGFLGPNGAGKTTTIRMMVGLSALTSGDLFISGYSIQSSYSEAIKHVGVIIENPEMYNHLTARKNMIHFARMNGAIDYDRINELIELVGLTNVIDKKVKTFSLGMKQRLGIAQALIHRPKLLILDEPTNGLDPEGIRLIRTYLRKLAKEEGLAVLVSSHLMSEMELMCDRFAIIQEGKMVHEEILVGNEEKKQSSFEVRVQEDQLDSALAIAKNFDHQAVIQESKLSLLLDDNEVSQFIRQLSGEVNVKEVIQSKESLEDRFLHLTNKEGVNI
ncbi:MULTISPECIES: ABC transporter ATP-binding protein [Shouchella]|uniref:ABC transporter ATP-binding protein n=2 Tax=Shouchella TaxID=2893057 RepID=A0ABY7W336_9BACI|nr:MULTISPECIES: ABC transporter ATP-binding protein [Shouchella]MED4130581.1 ABC transporter ATP-binding protein [Shouchella miscanthi]WDF03365.1 ABC transporter ATP-binding protein [Shouchella hunanensis]